MVKKNHVITMKKALTTESLPKLQARLLRQRAKLLLLEASLVGGTLKRIIANGGGNGTKNK